jgi:carotenoid cleavage dioxygenase-like enzyme
MRNPYLEDNFAPIRREHTVTELPVTGTIPPHLDGRYVRNGPNPATEVDPAAYHWFTGDGMVHGVRLRDGRAEWYRNRWIRSPRVAALLGEPYTGGPPTAPMVFVPGSAEAAEGDGVLMGYVYDAPAGRSDLMILDATTLETVAAIHLPARVPHGFHGNWLPSVT